MREKKLRDFLFYYDEVDQWAQYREKTADDVQGEAEVIRQKLREQIEAVGNRLEAAIQALDENDATFNKYKKTRRSREYYANQMIGILNKRRDDLRYQQQRIRRKIAWYPGDEARQAKVEAEALELDGPIAEIGPQIERMDALLSAYKLQDELPEPDALADLGVEDIVRWKALNYKAELESLDHDQLLEKIVARFRAEPERFPQWLQYMVIHFSGMRYKSAHGSWSDPKDLLVSLRQEDLEEELEGTSDEQLQALAEQKAPELEKVRLPNLGETIEELRLKLSAAADEDDAEAPDPREVQQRIYDLNNRASRLKTQLSRLRTSNPYLRRRAYLEVRLEEEKEAVESLSDEQALEALEARKDEFPTWMWSEIVARTQLRLGVERENWETLSNEEQQARWSFENRKWLSIMNEWEGDITAWRQEHAETRQLIVTRAVCNEVAEHIQHLRGLDPGGGLTAKPNWYLNKQRAAQEAGEGPQAYFKLPRAAGDFKAGASLLWLRWVKDKPNPWRIAHPLSLGNGDSLLPEGAKLGSRGNRSLGSARSGRVESWEYQNVGDGYRRTKTQTVEQLIPLKPGEVTRLRKQGKTEAEIQQRQRKKMVKQTLTEWLRWYHEATVVEVVDTVDGTFVITFETAFPDDGQGQSTIGVVKRPLYNYLGVSENKVFIGYVPVQSAPDLGEMLDWERILPGKPAVPERPARPLNTPR